MRKNLRSQNIVIATLIACTTLLAGTVSVIPASASTLGSITITSVSPSTASAGQPVTLTFLTKDTTGAPMGGQVVSIYDKQEGVIGQTKTGSDGTQTAQVVLFYTGTN